MDLNLVYTIFKKIMNQIKKTQGLDEFYEKYTKQTSEQKGMDI